MIICEIQQINYNFDFVHLAFEIFTLINNEGSPLKKIFLILFIAVATLSGCDDDSSSPSTPNTVKMSVANAVSGSKFFYTVVAGNVSQEDMQNPNLQIIIQDSVMLNASQVNITIPESNESGTYDVVAGTTYKIGYLIDVPPLGFNIKTYLGGGAGDGGGLLVFTAKEGETVINIDYNNLEWKISE